MSGASRTPPNMLAGIALLVAAVACFAVLDTTTKIISLSVPVFMAVWFRYAFQAIATTVAMLPSRGWSLLRTAHPKFQCLRGVLLLTTSMFAFFSLKHMPVGEFTAIVMITPLVITLLASLTLGERVSVLRWALVIGGFVGTLIIIRPGGNQFSWAMLLPLGLVISHAWFQILTSRLARTEDPVTMHFYTGWVGTLLASLALPFAWTSLDSWTLWAGLALMGLMGTVGHYMMILAYARAPVSTLTPFLYAQIGFAMLGGWLAFSHVPDDLSLLGMGMIAVCGATGAWLAVRESRVLIQATES
ncbi:MULTISPECIES: DMT family transporter [unclassified Polaromonas]|uniref:DMT family transporter n=1 Tax=unclassified Polaromonas TaxID=2638319 RepID=UPI0018CBDF59|nr:MULTISPECIES: DMT family transporter [unclassified Polaromonas]MBG6072992.1 drug/metabolite transporter (DMT)-like permease [Polaromonas sp. CG_9.7]MBG6114997.1 drug/metabolite transporter (DMT)-like permease [Polaromonas sp. CG_9.2]MDH6186080.1 drug/metabolite transporter (DMT)-like permease [Polaromonas sp. CG_23.6]